MLLNYLLNASLMACTSLLGSVNAQGGSRSMEQMIADQSQRFQSILDNGQSQLESASTSKYRYLNNNTEKFLLKSMPAVPYKLPEMYSGNIPISKSEPNRTLFFVFQPKIGEPVDEVTIWLNGGPGCSSLIGFFQENWMYVWTPGSDAPRKNAYHWANLTNMLWVDQPVGTGFSTGEVRARSEEHIAQEFLGFFKNFQNTFGIKKYKIYVTGESYAGRYIPYISAAMLDAKNKTYYDVAGALIYDGVIGSFIFAQEELTAVPYVLANNLNFGIDERNLTRLQNLHESCGYREYLDTYLTFPPPRHQPPQYSTVPTNPRKCQLFGDLLSLVIYINPCFNIYATNQQCPPLSDVLQFSTKYVDNPSLPSSTYFDRPDVKEAMHAPDQEWFFCGGSVFKGPRGDISADPIQKVLPQVIEATGRVLVSNGDFDWVIETQGTLLSIQNMTWNGKLGFQQEPSTPIVITGRDENYPPYINQKGVGQGVMGVQHFERGLMWAETYLAGHFQPELQYRSAYRHLEWVLGHRDTL